MVVAVVVVVVVCSAPTFYVLVSSTREKLPPDHIKEVAFALLQVLQEVSNTIHEVHTYIRVYSYASVHIYKHTYFVQSALTHAYIHTCLNITGAAPVI